MAKIIFNDTFCYIDGENINPYLICPQCSQPFIDPVIVDGSTRSCRRCVSMSDGNQSLIGITERILLGMLDELPVQCILCQQRYIKRKDAEQHRTRECMKRLVHCSARDLHCPWTGSHDQLDEHQQHCPLESLRPAITPIITAYNELKKELELACIRIDQLEKEQVSLRVAYTAQMNTSNERFEQSSLHSLDSSQNVKRRVQVVPKKAFSQHWQSVAVTKLGRQQGEGLDQLYSPRGLFIDEDQIIYIADNGNHRILACQTHASSGRIVAGGKGAGRRLDQLDRPTDVIRDRTTNSLLICDRGNRRVLRVYLQSPTCDGEVLIDNIDCWSLAMDKQGFLYVSDWKNHVVRRYDLGDKNQIGTVVAGSHEKGNGLHQLNFPTYLFVDSYSTVYVSDCNNHRVMKWLKNAREGVIVAGGNGKGEDLAQLSHPRGIWVDENEYVYVVDGGNHRVVCWDEQMHRGTVMVGGYGKGIDTNQLDGPEGLSLDHHGHLFIVDWGNHRLQCFSLVAT